MKKLFLMCSLALALHMTPPCACAIEYSTNIFPEREVFVGECFWTDIWLSNVPEFLVTAGFAMTWDPSLSNIAVEVYDGINGPDGPWDPGATLMLPDAYGPGTYMLAVLSLVTVPPGTGGDIIIARAEICPTVAGNNNIIISTIPEFDTIVGWPSQYCYDSGIIPNTVTVHQVLAPCRCKIIGPQTIQADGARTVTAQYSASSVNPLNCENQPSYVWSDSCSNGNIDQNGLLTIPPFTQFETCQICVTDTANTDINTGAMVQCCLPIEIRGG